MATAAAARPGPWFHAIHEDWLVCDHGGRRHQFGIICIGKRAVKMHHELTLKWLLREQDSRPARYVALADGKRTTTLWPSDAQHFDSQEAAAAAQMPGERVVMAKV